MSSSWHRWAWGLCAALWACLRCGAAWGQQVEPSQDDPRFRVYVAQRLEFLPDPDLSRQAVPQLDSARLVRAVERYFGQHPERFAVVPGDALLDAYDDPGSPVSPLRFLRSASQGNSSLERGVKSLSRFDLPEAERNLLDAASSYEAVQAPLLLPQELARVYEYLGQVYAEQGRPEEARAVFARMARLDGRRVLVYPYYHEGTEALYREGRARLLEARAAQGVDAEDMAELGQIAERVGADIVVWGYAEQRGEGVTLRLVMYRPGVEGPRVWLEEVGLPSDPEASEELADQLASRFAACVEPLPEPPKPPAEREKGHVYLDAAFAYALYLRPLDAPFDNLGFSVAGSYLVSDNFALFGRLHLLTSGSDEAQSLLNEFSSVRLFAGGAFTLRPWRWLRPFARFAVEGLRVGEFRRTDDFFCKVNPSAQNCDPDEIRTQEAGWFAGLNAGLGTSVRVYQDLALFVAGDFSFYFFPSSQPELNYPVGFDVGLEYRF